MVDVAQIKLWGKNVGAIRWDVSRQLGFFQYSAAFAKQGVELAPLKMPLTQQNRIYSFPELRPARGATESTFKGLPGLLADLLPDRYGNQLINSWLAKTGRPAGSMNPVEKLCFIGVRGMGALEFEPAHPVNREKDFGIEVNSLVETARAMLEQREQFSTSLQEKGTDAVRDVLRIGTSAGGARPKAVVALNPKTGELRSGQTTAPAGFEHWLLKLDGVSSEQFGESSGWGRVEYAYYLMAKDCGINIMPCQLIEENGRAHFLTQRFDREGYQKHHIASWCGLEHYDFNDMQAYSYEQLFGTMRKLKLTYPEAREMFRRMVFNVLATNYDDHTKNFSFILKQDDRWRLAPAYDLCFAYDEKSIWVNQQTLSINGKRNDITSEDFVSIAKNIGAKNARQIIEGVCITIRNWKTYAATAGVSKRLTQHIDQHLNAHTFQLD